MKRLILTVAALLLLVTGLSAQQPTKFLIFADTAGISPTGFPGTYMTWVFAKATPKAWPSSAVLVVWDCTKHQVKRVAQVKYEMKPDSSGVTGLIEEIDRPWQPVTDERLATLVCAIGPQHAAAAKDTTPAVVKPRSPYSES